MNIRGVTFFHGLGLNNNLNKNSKPQKTKKSFKNNANTNAPTKREKKKEDLHSIWEKIGLLIIDDTRRHVCYYVRSPPSASEIIYAVDDVAFTTTGVTDQ